MARMCTRWGCWGYINCLRIAARWIDWLLARMNTINLVVIECILHVNERGKRR